ncbi:glycosyltransferase family 4 protein [Paenibacillus alginolyticus]|uniref:Glycosyltransferase family 4 protein n=1 Tax=Paenibacillus alginolyticus TaxID=59839 RepID=A0ABT4G8X7_9BACL|nr:glycosyltransferase family 4 protein [Paenibacillus alginolyticus]MCY9692640.1 glycosyltransferase family 4 protein [Paenibacillus alginolyticus]MEC0143848.1 glycosyltransferase family 4 protein [Paenibacillus alginolyticus]
MPKKVLLCATVDYHFKAFHVPYMKWFKEQGWEVHVAANGNMDLPYVDAKFNVPIQRSPFHRTNINAYTELKSIIDENKYDIIHCHTPMGGVLARLAARNARRNGTKVIYTAHGFHFCQGAPVLNWLVYYPLEKFLSYFTDCLITINEEDYQLAVNRRFRASRIEYVHGVGVNTERFRPVQESHKREMKQAIGYEPDDILLFYAAEFNTNKNQRLLLQALASVKDDAPNVKLLLAGEGPMKELCQELAKEIGITDRVDFLGFRNDIDRLLPMCDIAVASSLREGLPVNIMEAMACGLPIIASENRGHKELVHNDHNGWITAPNDQAAMAEKIKLLAHNRPLRVKLGMLGREMVERKYATQQILNEKSTIYSLYMGEKVEGIWAIQ